LASGIKGVAYLDWFEHGLTRKRWGLGNDQAYQGYGHRAWRDGVKKRLLVLHNDILIFTITIVLTRVPQDDGSVMVSGFELKIHHLKPRRAELS